MFTCFLYFLSACSMRLHRLCFSVLSCCNRWISVALGQTSFVEFDILKWKTIGVWEEVGGEKMKQTCHMSVLEEMFGLRARAVTRGGLCCEMSLGTGRDYKVWSEIRISRWGFEALIYEGAVVRSWLLGQFSGCQTLLGFWRWVWWKL